MRRRSGTKVGVCFAFLLAFSFAIAGWSWAQEGICVFPTGTEEVAYPTGWAGSVLMLYASDDKVTRGSYVQVWVESDGHGCPPYRWHVTGRGFHFDNIAGATAATTNGDGEALQVWADNNACGSAFITVTDGCEGAAQASVREPTSGRWTLIEQVDCSGPNYLPGNCFCACGGTVIVGAYRYYSEWVGGTNMNIQYTGPLCDAYPEVPFPGNCKISSGGYLSPPAGTPVCSCAGFEPWFAVSEKRPGLKRKWRWDCP